MTETDKITNSAFFMLLRAAVSGQDLTEDEKKVCLGADYEKMYEMAVKQDLAHLIGEALGENKITLDSEAGAFFRAKAFRAMFRYDAIIADFENICNIFEDAKIAFIPLKGSVIRDFYNQPWFRTSCDIDILVKPEVVDEATQVLVEKAGYTKRFKGSHNVSIFSPGGIHIELHFRLMEKGLANNAASVLENVWESALVKDGYKYWMCMPDEMFYFYHIAHMAKHFENGGCGIRPFIDTWILDNIKEADKEKRDRLLIEGKLLQFAESARKLSRIWFKNDEHDSVSLQMENYILCGGLYGSNEYRIVVQQQKKGGRINYMMSKFFIPYDVIKYYYPILQKKPWLTPVMEVRRWGKLIFCGHLKRTIDELKYNNNISGSEADNVKKFLNEIGL